MDATTTKRDEQAVILGLYPRTVRILRQALCTECLHRGPREGCQFNLLPLTFKKDSESLKTCPQLEVWGLDGHKQRTLRVAKTLCSLDKTRIYNSTMRDLGV